MSAQLYILKFLSGQTEKGKEGILLKVMIVDDEELAIERLEMVLAEFDGIEICHTFLNPREAYEYAKTSRLDLAFLDIAMPEVNGMRLSRLLLELNPELAIVFVTGYDNYAVQAFEISALDYLMKPVTVQRMAKTLDNLRKRRSGSDFSGSNDKGAQRNALSPFHTLTHREAEMLHALSDGLSNQEIAVRFGITEATVKSHVFRLYGKLGVKRRSQAIAKARELNLIK